MAISGQARPDEGPDAENEHAHVSADRIPERGVVAVATAEQANESGFDEDPVQENDGEESREEPACAQDQRSVIDQFVRANAGLRRRQLEQPERRQ